MVKSSSGRVPESSPHERGGTRSMRPRPEGGNEASALKQARVPGPLE